MKGVLRPLRGTVALELVKDANVYQRIGFSRFKEYSQAAADAGFVVLGGQEGGAWISLHSEWVGKIL
jgi:hypothetical protein